MYTCRAPIFCGRFDPAYFMRAARATPQLNFSQRPPEEQEANLGNNN